MIDRGDLSRYVSLTKIPKIQERLTKYSKKNQEIFIATNFLETMIYKRSPSRAEVSDIYNAIKLKTDGLVLAAETAIGKYPIECVKF